MPLLTLKIAAGGFSEAQEIEVDDWVRPALNPAFKAIVIEGVEETDVAVVAGFLEVLA